MKKWLMMILVMASTTTYAGNEAGNGGVSVVCRDVNKRIIKAELLDIFEGRELYNLKFGNQNLNLETIVGLVQLKLIKYPDSLVKMQEELDLIEKKIVFIREGIELNPTNDAFPVISLKGCGFEQVANYTKDGDLFISKEIYDSFDVHHKAALYVHEAVYAMRRKLGDKDSRLSRQITAHLMATNGDMKVIEKLVSKPINTSPPSNRNMWMKRECGTKGSVAQRMEDCRERKEMSGLRLVTRTREGIEIYKDMPTGLVWAEQFPGTELIFENALNACHPNDVFFAGLTELNWRLPTKEEMEDVIIRWSLESELDLYNKIWLSTRPPNPRAAYVYNARRGSISLQYTEDVGSIKCVASN